MLYMKGIPYHYEELVRLGGYTVAADFKIAVKSENRFVLLEHIGCWEMRIMRKFSSGSS